MFSKTSKAKGDTHTHTHTQSVTRKSTDTHLEALHFLLFNFSLSPLYDEASEGPRAKVSDVCNRQSGECLYDPIENSQTDTLTSLFDDPIVSA